MARQLKPLWKCPSCGHEFVTANLWHSCSTYSLDHHFSRSSPLVRVTFDKLVDLAREFGPVTIYAQKTRIVFQVRVRFCGAMTGKEWLDVTLWLKRKASHPQLRRIDSLKEKDHVHWFRFGKPSDIDSKFKLLLGEAYRIGCQQHLAPFKSGSGPRNR